MIRISKRTVFLAAFLVLAAVAVPSPAAGPSPDSPSSPFFKAGKSGKGEISFRGGIPLIVLEGSPEQMGADFGALAAKAAGILWDRFISPASMFSGGEEKLLKKALETDPFVPARFREEMKAFAQAVGRSYGEILAANVFPDIYRKGGCSSFAALGETTKEGAPLLARNLDFFGMGILQKATVAVVFRPAGRKSFASVTWPGLSGVLSGMNEDGLCCAVMEVREGPVVAAAVPSPFLFRRVLEEASTVKEALKLLKGAKKAAGNNLILLDARGGAAVAEIGPGLMKVRLPEKGMVFSTNDHRAGKNPPPRCRRYERLETFARTHGGKIDIPSLKEVLKKVDQGILTVQSMIFEPKTLTILLATGKVPASKAPYTTISCARLLGKQEGKKKGEEKEESGAEKKTRLVNDHRDRIPE